MKNQNSNIPCHINPAVIKGQLTRLTRDELILEGKKLRMMAWETPPGNKRRMFVKLYQYCRFLYVSRYK